jgi:hypothetical protein
MQMHRAIAEGVLVEQFEMKEERGGQGRVAAADEHRHQDQVDLVNQLGMQRGGSQVGAAD